VEYFDEKTFLYYEESILSEKLINAGYKIMYYPAVSVVHKAGSTVSSYHTLRNSHNQLFRSERYYFKKYRNIGQLMYKILLLGEFIWLNAWVPIMGIKRKLNRTGKYPFLR
jgi:GT2 family glycosyltransferase